MVVAADAADEAAQHLDAGLAGDQKDRRDHDRDQELDDGEAEPGADREAVAGSGADIGLQLGQRGRQVDHGPAPLIVQLHADHRQIPDPGRRLGQTDGGEVAHQPRHPAHTLGERIDQKRDRHHQDEQQAQRHEHRRQDAFAAHGLGELAVGVPDRDRDDDAPEHRPDERADDLDAKHDQGGEQGQENHPLDEAILEEIVALVHRLARSLVPNGG